MENRLNRVMIRITLIFTFVMPAVLLNSMGIVILNLVNHMGVSKTAASWLEAFQGGSIIVGAFVFASFIPSIGYKKSMIIGIIFEIAACLLMWLMPSYAMAIVYYILCGLGFALVKTTIFALVGLITDSPSQHASNISLLEGFFMISVLSGFWIYGFFMDNYTWTTTFIFLGFLCVLNLIIVLLTFIDDSEVKTTGSSGKKSTQIIKDIKSLIRLLWMPLVWLFVIVAFFYVFIEQGVNNWLPTFKTEVLCIDPALSVKVASLFAGGLAVGRLLGSYIVRKISWLYVLMGGLVIAFILLVSTIYFSQQVTLTGQVAKTWSEVPYVAYLIPLVGVCIAPIYPTVCSLVLSSQPKRRQSSMAGLILFFSALGGTLGSNIIGRLFGIFGGLTAIKVPLVPMVIIFIVLIPFYKVVTKIQKRKNNG
jgi:MFS transporter, FHS family, glucose/mannose:H+ symporter